MWGSALTPNWPKVDWDSRNSISQKKSLERDGESWLLVMKEVATRENSDLREERRWSSGLSWSWVASKKMRREKVRGGLVRNQRSRWSLRWITPVLDWDWRFWSSDTAESESKAESDLLMGRTENMRSRRRIGFVKISMVGFS